MKRQIAICLVLGLIVACGGKSSSPAAPTPTTVNVAGVWSGTVRITSVSGGECVAALFPVGTQATYTFQVQQSGSVLTAIATSTTTGLSTNYTGTAGSNTVAFNATSSTAGWLYGLTCASGQRRDMGLVAETITATVSGNTGSGTAAETYNVYVAGTTTGVGTMSIASTFTMTR